MKTIKTSSHPLSDVMQQEAVSILYGNLLSGLAISLVSAIAIVFVFFGSDQDSHKLYWLLAMFMSATQRFIDLLLFKKNKANSEDFNARTYKTRFFVGCVISALVWSAYPFLFYENATLNEQATSMIIMTGLSGGAATTLSGSRVTAMSFVLILMVPYSCILILSDSEHHHGLGIIGACAAVVLAAMARKNALLLRRSIELKFENGELLQQMEEKVKQRSRQIYELSHKDPLTGLFNRAAFLEAFQDVCSHSETKRNALFFIDLDGYKLVNDGMGHAAGDKIMKSVAERITSFCSNASLICRWGGDEFLVLVPYHSQSETLHQANELIANLSQPYPVTAQSSANIGATIGISVYPEHGLEQGMLVQRADMAMYEQKRSEKGRARFFDNNLQQQLLRELHIRNCMLNAINSNDFFVMFQPIMKKATGEVVYIEALARWKLDNEFISPAEFIPIAEQYGLIKSLGCQLMEDALMKAKNIVERNESLKLCFNVSINQLNDTHFAEIILEALQFTGFPADRLVLEMTETAMAEDKSLILNQLQKLRQLNIQIAIDDFGTGYSSLAYMQNFEIDLIKLDRSFITQIDSEQTSIIKAVTELSKAFHFEIIAEGIELEEQADRLVDLGITLHQGFLYHRPMEVEKLAQLLK